MVVQQPHEPGEHRELSHRARQLAGDMCRALDHFAAQAKADPVWARNVGEAINFFPDEGDGFAEWRERLAELPEDEQDAVRSIVRAYAEGLAA